MPERNSFNEFRQRGTLDFPLEFHHLDHQHPKYQMTHHWHHECELIRILEGNFTVALDNRSLTATAGDMLFINSGTVHGGAPEQCTYECIVFDARMLLKKGMAWSTPIQQIADREILVEPLLPRTDLSLSRIFHELFETLAQQPTGYQVIAIGALYQLFGRILQKNLCTRRSGDERTEHKRTAQIKRVLSKIESCYGDPLTLEELSREAGMSPKYFCQFFQEITRRTPIDYLNYYRIEQATYQMVQSDASVTEIAYRCGFNDLSYFIRAFKKYKGITPGRYEKLLRQSESSPPSSDTFPTPPDD